ncbi:MAG: SUMF1/EgtB/PvdO family nonheme iron enzyme, partial [Verrucomicrobia bacterium]|nr:SUMF1/EgtB/PvdO family nonheme iron enzyme [Verrucomicrobiota bacterium]
MSHYFKLTAGLLGLALTTAVVQAGISAGENVTFPLTDTVDLEMIWVEPGTFIMGSPRNEPGRWSTEVQHEVTLTKGYWMGKYEVTQAQYEAVTGSNPSGLKGADLPVELVRWYDATNFCAKLTEIEKAAGRLPEGYEFTLPTEAQWEYACRAGTTTAFNNGKDLTEAGIEQCPEMDEVGWYKYNSDFKTHPVGQKQPNAWGLYDMHGNIAEWCLDWFGDYPESSVTDPMGPDTGSHRVIRGGGSYTSNAGGCRSAFRVLSNPGDNLNSFGFRVALINTQEEEPPTISCKAEGNELVINYTGTLYQSIDTVNWTEVANASSPYRVAMSEKMLFFRTQGGVPIYKNMTIPLGDDVELDMIWIDPGTFMMGSPENEIGRDGEEYLHSETIRFGFWLGKYE